MEKYFSCSVAKNGCCSSFNTIYKKDISSKVYIVSDGNDMERTEFFNRLIENFRGFTLSVFNPFYSDSADGIYIKDLNTYILSNGEYHRISPVLSGEWEKYISIVPQKSYSDSLKRKILPLKSAENAFYKESVKYLSAVCEIREKIHREVSDLLQDEKLINFLTRFCARKFRNAEKRGGCDIKLLSTPTPLGIHTHYETMFENYDSVICVTDKSGFASGVILGIIKDYALSEKIPFIISPSFLFSNIPQFLIFPSLSLAIVNEDSDHPLTFEPQKRVNAVRFLHDGENFFNSEKYIALSTIEEKLFKKCIMNLYEGTEKRFNYNYLLKDISDCKSAEQSANELSEKITG